MESGLITPSALIGTGAAKGVTSRLDHAEWMLTFGADAGLIQSLFQALLPGLSAWAEVGGIAPSLWLKAPLLQPIST